MNARWTLTSTFNGRLHIPGRPETLGLGESCPWIGAFDEVIGDHMARRRLRATPSVESTLPKLDPKPVAVPVAAAAPVSLPASETPAKKPSDKK